MLCQFYMQHSHLRQKILYYIKFPPIFTYYKKQIMIPSPITLERFVRSRMNFFLYGPRASGKTKILKDTFQKTKIDYIYINCTMGDKKANFFRYLNHQTHKYFKKKMAEKSLTLAENIQKPSDPQSVHAWLQQIRSLDVVLKSFLKTVYFFIDNIQQIHVSANFMTTFYSACQQDLQDLKIPFVFCGVNLPRKIYAVDKPFRNITSFCMPKPLKAMQDIINSTVYNIFHSQFVKTNSEEDIKKGSNLLSRQIYAAFQSIETDLNKIKKIAQGLSETLSQLVKNQIQEKKQMKNSKDDKQNNSNVAKVINSIINKGQHKKYIRQMQQQGPSNDFIFSRKIKSQQATQLNRVQLPYEFYPNLLMTACHFADLAHQKSDRYRFKDYKKSNSRQINNQQQNRITRHTVQRVIAISQVLECVSKNNIKEQALQHHTLDFYGCLEFLKDQDKFFTASRNLSFANGKIHGLIKEQEVKTFCKKNDIEYNQFAKKD